jgi:hypothetical protein
MKVLIVGKYPLSDQQSMHHYAELLVHGLEMAGVDVRIDNADARLWPLKTRRWMDQ